MNDVSLIGRFVRPVEIKLVGNDKYVVNNVLAISKRWKNDKGQSADFIPVSIWGKAAQIVEKYCDKGNLIGLTGHLASKQYQSADGKKQFGIEFIAEQVHLIEGKRYVVPEETLSDVLDLEEV